MFPTQKDLHVHVCNYLNWSMCIIYFCLSVLSRNGFLASLTQLICVSSCYKPNEKTRALVSCHKQQLMEAARCCVFRDKRCQRSWSSAPGAPNQIWSCHRRTGLITSEGDGARSDGCTESSCSWREALSRSFPKHRCTLAGTNPWPGLTKDDYFLWISCQTVPMLSFQEHQLLGSDHLFALLLHSFSMTQWKKRADAGD